MFGSLKDAYELTKELTALQVSAEFKTKITELLDALIEAREDAFAAQEERATLLAKIRELEEQAAKREGWLTEKQRYQLCKLEGAAVAYVLQPSHRSGQAPHALCAQCFDEGKKGYLQPIGAPGSYHLVEHRCSGCGAKSSFPKYALGDAWKNGGGEA